MKKPNICKCCGHPLPPADEIERTLTAMQWRMYEMVHKAGTMGLRGEAIMERLYADDPDGGALTRNIVAVMARQMNKRLEPLGLQMRGQVGRGNGTYKIRTLKGTADASHR